MEKKKIQCYEKENLSSIKYICYNKQLKNLCKFIPMNISQQIITIKKLLTLKKLQILTFFSFFSSIFELKITVCDDNYAYLIFHSAVVIPAQGLSKKNSNWIQFVHNYHVLKFENNLKNLIFFMFFSIFELKIRVFNELYDY